MAENTNNTPTTPNSNPAPSAPANSNSGATGGANNNGAAGQQGQGASRNFRVFRRDRSGAPGQQGAGAAGGPGGASSGGFVRRRPGGFGGGGQGGENNSGGGNRRSFGGGSGQGGPGGNRRRSGDRQFGRKPEVQDNIDSIVIQVRRVTKVVKGGKNMRFSALVVAGDKQGRIGYGLKKGLDFQDAVAKATKKAKDQMFAIQTDENGSLLFPILTKYKACQIFLKPAHSGTGLIAGGFLRPVLDLAGIKNVYSKIIGSNNKVVGIQASLEALKQYSATQEV